MNGNIIVTGGAGFIGSHVAEALSYLGNRVVVIDNLSGGKKENLPAGIEFHRLDIRDPEIEQLFVDFKPEVLCHLAAQMDVRKSVEDPRTDCDINVGGLIHLLECGRKAGLKKVIFASTGGAIYGEPLGRPSCEEDPVGVLSPYGISKFTGENYLRYYTQQYGIQNVILRFSNVYGPRQNSEGEAGVVAIFISHLLEKKRVTIYGQGSQTRDFVYVGDVVAAFKKSLEDTASGIFNISTGIETSVNELLRQIATLMNLSPSPVFAPSRKGEVERSVLSSAKAQKCLQWVPQTSLAKGLSQTIEYFQRRPSLS
jgi:UDP-glucose 4-epimerase